MAQRKSLAVRAARAEPLFISNNAMSAKRNKSAELRIGADFGPGHTGLAVLDGGNRVLARAVVVHRADVSDTLKTRRANRAMRRRAESRRRRLRDFRVLLDEMGIPPRLRESQNESREAFRARVSRVGNKLHALAHRRGWDWAELEELLVERPQKGPPRKTALVREADDFLKKRVPPGMLQAVDGPPKRNFRRGESESDLKRRVAEWQSVVALLENGKHPDDKLLRFARLRQTCLGELAEAEQAAHKNPDDPDARDCAEDIRRQLGGGRRSIVAWLDSRVRAAFGGEAPDEPELAPIRDNLLARLGLTDGKAAFDRGEIFTPHRNRHRDEMLRELNELLAQAETENAAAAPPQTWRRWKQRARAALNRQYRQKRFANRNPGKCAARTPDGERCNRNLPKRGKVRELLFDEQALQMRVVDGDGEIRNLRPDELAELKQCVNFRKGTIRDDEKWRAFFKRLPPPKSADDDGDESQAKPDQLRAVAKGPGEGRVRALCRDCLRKKVALLKVPKDGDERGDDWNERWNALHGETIYGPEDAPPSLRQKTDAVCGRVSRMLREVRARHPELRTAEVVHIGVERAAFDISAISSPSGKRPNKKSAYQKSRGRDIDDLASEQDGFCIYCDNPLGLSRTVDHVGPRRRGGGDSAVNRVAMCAHCNILKGKKREFRFAEKATAALRRNNPEKADHLKKNAGRIANLSAPQQTMFGAKVLRGALAEALLGDRERAKDFPVVRARDTALLRERWFPNIHRQKRALRADRNDGFIVVESGGNADGIKGDLNPGHPQFAEQSEPGKIALAPNPGDEGIWNLALADGGELRVAVVPPDDSPVREYHHIVDAIVAAANVDWKKIARLERDIRDLPFPRRRKFWQTVEGQADSGRPAGPLAADAVVGEPEEWMFRDKTDKSGPNRARTKRQPLRKVLPARTAEKDRDEILVQRKPLHEIARADIPKIPDSARLIREALQAAWKSIDAVDSADDKKAATPDGKRIAPEWFLQKQREARQQVDALPPEERDRALVIRDGREVIRDRWFREDWENRAVLFLQPHRVRSVSLRTGLSANVAFAVRSAKDPETTAHTHFFPPENPAWDSAAVWTEKNKLGKPARKLSRRRAKFYRGPENKSGKRDPLKWDEWESGVPPENAAALRRGCQVRLETAPGLWRLNEIRRDGRATLAPDNDESRRFAAAAPASAKIQNLFWPGLRVRREDKFPPGEGKAEKTVPGVWKVESLRQRAVLVPDDNDAKAAARQGASRFALYPKLRPADSPDRAEDIPAERVRRAKEPGLWRVEKSHPAPKGAAIIVPDDDSARRFAKATSKTVSPKDLKLE